VSDHVFSQFLSFYQRAELYFAYNSIYRYVVEPFTDLQPETLLQTALFIVNTNRGASPYGVSNAYTQFTLSKQAMALGAYKVAKSSLDQLLRLKIPASWRDQIELGVMTMRTKLDEDKDELRPICYRCGTVAPLLCNGDKCPTCSHELIRSFSNFQQLPLVEFELDGISDEKALTIFKAETELKGTPTEEDSFLAQLTKLADAKTRGPLPISIKVNEVVFRNIARDKTQIFVSHWPRKTKPYRYFRNIVPEVPVLLCDNCQHFFHQEDFEAYVIRHNTCPFCRIVVDASGSGGTGASEDVD